VTTRHAPINRTGYAAPRRASGWEGIHTDTVPSDPSAARNAEGARLPTGPRSCFVRGHRDRATRLRGDRLATPYFSAPCAQYSHAVHRPGRCRVSTPTSVYRYYDRMGALIYVGITSRGIRRNIEHNLDREWWPYVVTQEVDHYATRDEALLLERHLIRKYEPPFNVQHNPNHEGRRADYLGVASIQPIRHAVQLYSLLGRAIPLLPFDHHPGLGRLVMRTHTAHQLIASGLLMPQSRKVSGYVINESKKGYLRLLDITQDSGRFTLLHFQGPQGRRVPPAESGKVSVKLACQNKPVTFSIEKITLVRDEAWEAAA
jgi:hypothetical protein